MAKEADEFMNAWHARVSKKTSPHIATSLKVEGLAIVARHFLVAKKVCTEEEFDTLFVQFLKNFEDALNQGKIQTVSPIQPEDIPPKTK
jgi:hypothetical protein